MKMMKMKAITLQEKISQKLYFDERITLIRKTDKYPNY